MKKNKRIGKMLELVMHSIFLVLGLITVGCVLLITVYLVISGIPAIRRIGLVPFLFNKTWASTAATPSFGILPFILTSIYGTAGAILLGVPVGFFTAVYLAKMAKPSVRSIMQSAVSMLSGIPSVVYGLVGMLILVPGIRRLFNVPDGSSLLAAIIVLSIMILPSIIKVSVTALEAVPKEYEDASLALGATPVETYFRVSVPAAKSGIAAAVVLGVGRAIGEAMAVMMVSGNVPNMPSLFQSVRFLTTAVASEMSYSSGLQQQALFSIALGGSFVAAYVLGKLAGNDKLLGTYHLCKAGKRITGYILIRLINTGKSRCAGHLKGRCDLHICICYAGGSQGVLIHLLGTPVNVLGGYIQSGAVVQYCDIHAGDGLMAYLFVVYQAFEVLPLIFVCDGYLGYYAALYAEITVYRRYLLGIKVSAYSHPRLAYLISERARHSEQAKRRHNYRNYSFAFHCEETSASIVPRLQLYHDDLQITLT